jgi:hypothetical protein
MLDHPFGEWWNQDGANTASGEEQGERKSPLACEPGKDRARVRELCGGVCDQADYKKGGIELNDIGVSRLSAASPTAKTRIPGRMMRRGESDRAKGR